MGTLHFPQGVYIYTGSARRNILKRIQRHLDIRKKTRWHIDYLVCQSSVLITGVRLSFFKECILNKQTPGKMIIPGFGSSDCMQGCSSHLKYLKF
jgi:Uri superfamily endonuclease